MIKLIVCCHAMSHTLAFGTDRAAAESQLALLLPKIGRDRWGKNGKEEEPTHTIHGPTGDTTAVLEKVEVVRLVDTDADWDIGAADAERELNYRARIDLEYRRKLAAEGFST